MEKITYLGLPGCVRFSNGSAELVVATQIGPRILRYALAGGKNAFGEYPDRSADTAYGAWKPYGGHRLWIAPERMPETYAPDNAPVSFEAPGELTALLTQHADRAGVEKQILITLDATGSRAEVRHTVVNRSAAAIEVAPWALTIMRAEQAIVPLAPWQSHDDVLTPAQPVVRWHFTDLADSRWRFGRQSIRVRTDASNAEPQKIGLLNKEGWCACLNGRTLFVKRFDCVDNADYPDYGCNNEVYVEGDYLELESLGPLHELAPGESANHTEQWELFDDIDPAAPDQEIAALIRASTTLKA